MKTKFSKITVRIPVDYRHSTASKSQQGAIVETIKALGRVVLDQQDRIPGTVQRN